VPIGLEALANGKIVVLNDDRLQQCPLTGSVILKATVVADERPTWYGKPAFLSPPP